MSNIQIGRTSFDRENLMEKKLEDVKKEFEHIDPRVVTQAWKEANKKLSKLKK